MTYTKTHDPEDKVMELSTHLARWMRRADKLPPDQLAALMGYLLADGEFMQDEASFPPGAPKHADQEPEMALFRAAAQYAARVIERKEKEALKKQT